MHCVRGYGHLADLFRKLSPEDCPPKVMLHSFGGDVQVINQFVKIPKIGDRFYFSFSTVINGKAFAKMAERIKHVPENRLLIESDQNTPSHIDGAMEAAVAVVMHAKGWSLEEAVSRTYQNFRDVFSTCLPP